jgi:hypothetical protein
MMIKISGNIKMNLSPFIILLVCTIVLTISYYLYNQTDEIVPHDVKHNIQNIQNKVRCPPDTRCQYIPVIKNKGYVNDMMYKPDHDMSELRFENKLIENNEPLNDSICKTNSVDLPLSNINVNYLLKYNTSKLHS